MSTVIVIVTDPAHKEELLHEQTTVEALRAAGHAAFGDPISLDVIEREGFEKTMEKAHALLQGVFRRGYMDSSLFFDQEVGQLYVIVAVVGGSKPLIAEELTANISRR